jgi:EAL domain-containing protein (putative c-di-GMP-specific phosphodiesterase class I)
MIDSEQAVRVLTELKNLGLRLAIDDFGTGYSSLSYLRQFPVELIKIDKSFIDPLNDANGDGAAFVRSIIRLAHSLGLRTIAEGIEHADQRDRLAGLGCDSAQGFLMGRPLDVRAASSLVRSRPERPADASATIESVPLVGQSDKPHS